MIRRLEEKDREEVMDLLTPESALNLFIIGDIENNGFRTDYQELWGDFDARGNRPRLRAVLLRYHRIFTPYAPGEFDVDGLADVIRGHGPLMNTFSGVDRVIRRFEACPGLLPATATRRTLFFVELKNGEGLAEKRGEPLPPSLRLERATPADVPAFFELWREIAEFRLTEDDEESSRRELEQGASRGYLIRDGGRVLATVRTAAENSRGAMILGVATHPDYRRRGLATRLLAHLCRELLAEGKRPCLFYDNAEAGGLYRRLGFKDVGKLVMYELGEQT